MRYIQEDEAYRLYDQMLDDTSDEASVGSLHFKGSEILKNCDPIAYDCGFSDFCDSEDITTEESEADEEEDN